MTAAAPLTYPGGRTFAGWQRQFASLHPFALFAGDFRVEQIETLVRVRRQRVLDARSRALLDILPGMSAAAPHAERATIEPSLFRAVTGELQASGLILIDAAGSVVLTEAGSEARASGHCRVSAFERRQFSFLDFRPAAPPLLVNAGHWPLQAWPGTTAATAVGTAALQEALHQTDDWKKAHGFPEDVDAVVGIDDPEPDEKWRRIAVVRVLHLCAAVVGSDENGRREWRLLAAKFDGWSVPAGEPLLTLPESVIPVIGEAAWRESWRQWCKSRRLTTAEADAVQLKIAEREIVAIFAESAPEAVRKARDELLRSDTWLTADSPPFRRGMPLRAGK